MKRILLLLLICGSWLGYSQCLPPIQVSVTNVTTTSFTVSWTTTGPGTLWEVIVVPAGTVPGPNDQGMIATVNPFVVAGLQCSSYMVHVRSVCEQFYSPWTAGVLVNTCGGNLPPVQVCDLNNDGVELVDLGIYNMEFEGQMPEGNYEFSYYLSEADAGDQVNPLPQMAMVPTTMIIVRADNLDSPGTFQLFELMVILNPVPEIDGGYFLDVCDPDGNGLAVFNLNTVSQQIFTASGQTPNTWSVNFYETMADAANGSNQIWNTQEYQNIMNPQTLYVAAMDNMTGCRTVSTVTLEAGTCDGILLTAFLDSNGNGTMDSGEVPFPHGSFTYTVNGGQAVNLSSLQGSVFIADGNNNNDYAVSYSLSANYAGSFSVNPSSATATAGPGVQEIFFAVSAPQEITELVVSLIPINNPQPGFNYANKVVFSNFGTTQQSGTVTFTNDSNVTVISMPSGAVATSSGFTYAFTNLLPFETREFTVMMNVPTIPTVSLGQMLTNSVAITVPAGDILPGNNMDSLTQNIIGSYDPNDKVEAHGGPIVLEQFSPDEELIYTIRFENTGTAPASFITVEDELDAQLDAGSLRMISASHDYVLTKNGQSLSWFFDDVNLPPTMQDPVGSHGYITFAVKPMAGLEVGDIIPNTAAIFFDFNPAIVTNTFQTEFMAPMSTPGFGTASLKIHPNPASEIVQVHASGIVARLIITDMTGKIVMELESSEQNPNVNIGKLHSGLYLMQVTLEDGTRSVQKLIKN